MQFLSQQSFHTVFQGNNRGFLFAKRVVCEFEEQFCAKADFPSPEGCKRPLFAINVVFGEMSALRGVNEGLGSDCVEGVTCNR